MNGIDKELQGNKAILIVEDEVEFAEAMVVSLSGAGYAPMSVGTLREANFKIRNQKFSCILLDIRLGGDSGLEVIELLRKHKQTLNADTPIVVISGFLDAEVVKSIAGHVQGALVKPFDPDEFLDRVTKAINREVNLEAK